MKYFITLFFFSFQFFCIGQNMKKGFTFLETGKYAEAKVFFNEILKTYPSNKTARLCYGRAVGLNGEALKATEIFSSLLNDYPGDFEIELNYAESLLWGNNFNEAKVYYERLIQKNKTSFAALLGYANTLSNLKEYPKALTYVNKALEVQPGNNNALVSKKYIRFGLANEKTKAQEYDKAEIILKKVLDDFEGDLETLQILANLYLMSEQQEKAKLIFEQIGKNPNNTLISLNGIALAQHLDENDKLALNTSTKAKNLIDSTTVTSIKERTIERYIQALIWNAKYNEAEKEIETLIAKEEKPLNWMLSLRATLNVYRSNFKKSIRDYNTILATSPNSFDGNLGKANAYKALRDYTNAYAFADSTLYYYENQKDAIQFIKTLDRQFTPFIESKASYSFDNGNNEATMLQLNSEFPFSTKFKVFGNYQLRNTFNTKNGADASSNSFSAGIEYQLFPNLTFKSDLGLFLSESNETDYSQILTNLSFQYQPLKLQNIELGYKKELQNFNAELQNREIVLNNLYVNYSLNTNIKIGLYSQYFYTWQSDGNTRNLLFASLYYNILKKPSLKAGVNFQNISFENQVPAIYFSPSIFNAAELFVNIIKPRVTAKNNEWFYELTAAAGLQYIEDDARQSTYRFQGKLGYKFSERSMINLFGTHSNIASAIATGFTFTEVGLHYKYYLFECPIFKTSALF